MFSPPRARRRSRRYLKYSTWPPWYEDTAMPCTSSSSAALTTSSTERLCPRWMTSQPLAWRMRRTMLIDASCPSNSDAAVTKRILFFALYSVWREALRSVMAALGRGGMSLVDVYVNVKVARPQIAALRNRRAFTTTDTELALIAAAAIIGFSRSPVQGNSTPAAIGTPTAL